MTIKTRLSVPAVVVMAFITTLITTDSSARDQISRTVPPGPVAHHARYTGNLDDFRRIPAHKNLTPPRPFDKGGCNFCHDPESMGFAPPTSHSKQ